MLTKLLSAIIVILIGVGAWQYFQLESFKQEQYEARISAANDLAAADSLREIAEGRYAKLSYQYFNLDSVASKYKDEIASKNGVITSLTQINASLNVNNEALKNIIAKFDSTENAYIFKVDSTGMYVVGRVYINDDVIVTIDTLQVPIELDVLFVKYEENNLIEVQVQSNNPYIAINNFNSYIKVPEKPFVKPKTFQPFIGGLVGNQWGVFGGIKYKSIYLIGTMQNTGWSGGLGYGF